MKRLFFVITALLLLPCLTGIIMAGCSTAEKASTDYAEMPASEIMDDAKRSADYDSGMAEYNAEMGEQGVKETEERIIKEGWVEFVTDDVEAKTREINEAAREYNANITASSLSTFNERMRATLTVKVKSNFFDSLYNELGEMDDLVRKESASRDVTMEYVDLSRRLEVYRTQEERYLEMLENAENIEEMLEVERELGRIRLEIESIEGKLNYFDSVTDYSHIDITIAQRKAVATAKTPDNIWEEFVFSFTEGWRYFSAVVVSIAASLIWGFPFIITIGVIVFIIIFIIKRSRVKNNINQS